MTWPKAFVIVFVCLVLLYLFRPDAADWIGGLVMDALDRIPNIGGD